MRLRGAGVMRLLGQRARRLRGVRRRWKFVRPVCGGVTGRSVPVDGGSGARGWGGRNGVPVLCERPRCERQDFSGVWQRRRSAPAGHPRWHFQQQLQFQLERVGGEPCAVCGGAGVGGRQLRDHWSGRTRGARGGCCRPVGGSGCKFGTHHHRVLHHGRHAARGGHHRGRFVVRAEQRHQRPPR